MKILVLFISLIAANVSFAENLSISTDEVVFQQVTVSANNVKGVNIRLETDVVRDSCNLPSLNFSLTYASGNKDFGWHQTQFATAYVASTEMFCPLDIPINETIQSLPIFVNSLINKNANGEVLLTLIVPAGYKVLVEEVKLD